MLKPKKGVGCGKSCSPPIAISCFTFITHVTFVTFVTHVTFVTFVMFATFVTHVTFVTHASFAFIRSIREIRVQKQNAGFVFRFVYSFANARYVGF